MEDWAYGLAIVLWAILWVTIFVDYRKRLIMVLPSIEEVSTRKHSFSSKISEAEDVIDITYAPRHSLGWVANTLKVDHTSLFSLFLNWKFFNKFLLCIFADKYLIFLSSSHDE